MKQIEVAKRQICKEILRLLTTTLILIGQRFARNEDNKANISDSIANTYKVKLQNINYSNIPTPIGGIWVFLEIEYKEYLYKCFAGLYVKRFLYLYSNDGEKKTYSSEVYFDNLTSCCCSDYVSLFDTEEQRQCLGCCN